MLSPVLPLLLASSVAADTAVSRAEAALSALQTWYNGETGMWNTCGWWNGANCMTVLAELALVDDATWVNDTAKGVFANTYAVGPKANPYPDRHNETYYSSASKRSVDASLWLDGSYDDDAWWALAWIAAYDVTGIQEYLDTAKGIFESLSNAWPSKCGNGGIDSDYTHVYVNAVTNELFFSVAAHLANRASDRKYYIDWATKQWKWFNSSGLINENYTINDGLTNDCKNNGAALWSYNQGIVLGGLAELHRAAHNASDLPTAKKIAKAAIAALADDNNVIRESCEPDDCDANATQFKGIFIRNLKLLHSVAPDDAYAKVINASANSVWNNDRNAANNQLGVVWAGPVGQIDASTHSSAMDALVAAIE
ncbi:glycoside hydrolase [Aspergillus avenaceus]|uniref:Glycoside hydrolase n=1 Tax=Aspergillus avenaceus TaxID=36643 RepID=A0A5N6U7S4_ASPAV|nr:glycoside hydrolase [Aspergillus avenaceus]